MVMNFWVEDVYVYAVSCIFRNLPAKSEEESQRHRQEYSEMVAGAKRRGE